MRHARREKDHLVKTEQAEALALGVLTWMLGDPERTGAFLGWSGADADILRTRAGEPEFLASVLDFLLLSDADVLGFCSDARRTPAEVMAARAALPGGDVPHWT